MVDLTLDPNEVVEIPDEEVKKSAVVDEENWGEYDAMDISSLSRDSGIRNYFKRLHRNYIHGGITLAQKAEEEEEAKLKGKIYVPTDHDDEGFGSDMSE